MIRNIVFFSLLILLLVFCSSTMLTESRQERCLMYKGTLATLVDYTLTFYPHALGVEQYKIISVEYRNKIKQIGRINIFDRWGNNYIYSGKNNVVYSMGINLRDDSGAGDDITLLGSSKNIYCNNENLSN